MGVPPDSNAKIWVRKSLYFLFIVVALGAIIVYPIFDIWQDGSSIRHSKPG